MPKDPPTPVPPGISPLHDRDRRTIKTPPSGVVAQIAPPDPEPDSWEDQSGGGKAVTAVKVRPPTAVGESPVETLVRRSGETKNTTLELVERVDKIEEQGKATHKLVAETVLPSLVEQTKQNTTIITLLTHERDRSGHLKTETTLSQIKVTETEQLATIDGDTKDRDARREVMKEFALKAITGVSALAALVLGILEARRC